MTPNKKTFAADHNFLNEKRSYNYINIDRLLTKYHLFYKYDDSKGIYIKAYLKYITRKLFEGSEVFLPHLGSVKIRGVIEHVVVNGEIKKGYYRTRDGGIKYNHKTDGYTYRYIWTKPKLRRRSYVSFRPFRNGRITRLVDEGFRFPKKIQ